MHPFILAASAVVLAMAVAFPARAESSRRVLLIFSAADEPRLETQRTLLAAAAPGELTERDLVVVHVLPDGKAEVLLGKGSPSDAAPSMRRGPKTAFSVVLVGKDGGAKWRDDRPIGPGELFGLIDAMPMRALELKRNRPAG